MKRAVIALTKGAGTGVLFSLLASFFCIAYAEGFFGLEKLYLIDSILLYGLPVLIAILCGKLLICDNIVRQFLSAAASIVFALVTLRLCNGTGVTSIFQKLFSSGNVAENSSQSISGGYFLLLCLIGGVSALIVSFALSAEKQWDRTFPREDDKELIEES